MTFIFDLAAKLVTFYFISNLRYCIHFSFSIFCYLLVFGFRVLVVTSVLNYKNDNDLHKLIPNHTLNVQIKYGKALYVWIVYSIVDFLLTMTFGVSFFLRKRLKNKRNSKNSWETIEKYTSILTIIEYTYEKDFGIKAEKINYFNSTFNNLLSNKMDYIYHSTEEICTPTKYIFSSLASLSLSTLKRYRIVVKNSLLKDFDNWNDKYVEYFTDLNFININLFTKFTDSGKMRNKCIFDIIRESNKFFEFFPKIYKLLIEILIINEDGFKLVNKLLSTLDNIHGNLIQQFIIKCIFNEWPPPLWYHSLLKYRQIIRNHGNMNDYLFYPSLIDFIQNPFQTEFPCNLSSLMNLKYKKFWINYKFKYGIFENINYPNYSLINL